MGRPRRAQSYRLFQNETIRLTDCALQRGLILTTNECYYITIANVVAVARRRAEIKAKGSVDKGEREKGAG